MNSQIKLINANHGNSAADQSAVEFSVDDSLLSYYWPCYWPDQIEIDCDCAALH
ncbi:hypothetical protein [Rubellicoccus peritrichatus]|uniref:Uncharacterized protein n=1 Tax=Rubellicoccus peritrichatus TaxID=3080537 RepID=A0AAQ3L6J6_9BACT|nr:hypothetical protein [Puniceicoccus sp. CR14]WOO40250.1 hypothetical protein RZN69_16645 [Puniceicoccus sp. CR14]